MSDTELGRVLRTGLSQAEPEASLGPPGFDPSREEIVTAALEAWRALPDDERNGERPFIFGFNAGWDEALDAAAAVAKKVKAYDDNVQRSAGCSTSGERIAALVLGLKEGR